MSDTVTSNIPPAAANSGPVTPTTPPPVTPLKPVDTSPVATTPSDTARTPEDIDALVQAIQSSLSGQKPKPKPEEPKVEEPVKKAAPKKQPPKPSAQEQSIERSAERITAAALKLEEATELANKPTPEPDRPVKPTTATLSPKDQRTLDAIEEMARLFPAEYGEHATLYKAGFAKERAYIEEWKQENKGQTFDPDADDHSEFYEQSFPQFDDADFTYAQAHLAAHHTLKKENAKLEEAHRQEQSSKRITESVNRLTEDASTAMLKQVDDKVESIEMLREADPVAAYVAERAQNEMKTVVNEVARLFSPGSTLKASPDNPLHQQIFSAIQTYENSLSGLTPEQLVWDRGGEKRSFSTWQEFSSMPPKQQAKHWTLWTEPEQVGHLLANDYAMMAKVDIEKLRGPQKSAAALSPNSTAATYPKNEVPINRNSHKTASAPEGGGSVRTTTLPTGSKSADDLNALMVKSMFGG